MIRGWPLLWVLTACQPAPEPPPTFHANVQPLIEARCHSCHQTGGIAGLPLETLEQVTASAAAIKVATGSRRMPPSNVDASGACQKFKDAPWLSTDELDVLAQWADGEQLAGEEAPRIAAPPVVFAPTHVLEAEQQYVPSASLTDDYRCFLVDPKLAEDRFIVAYRVEPGDARVVHHVILFNPESPEDEHLAAQLDEGDPALGYSCFGGPGVTARPVAAWAPGTSVTRFPDQTGLRLLKNRRLVMQVHYNTRQGALPDRTRISLELVSQVPIEGTIVAVADPGLELAPGQLEASSITKISLPVPIKVVVRGVFPHMHRLGRSMKLELNRTNKWMCAVDVPKWDFDSQRFYFYDKPISVLPGEQLRLSCNYDTTSRTSSIHWGEGTDDEMCLAGLFVTPR